MSLAMVPSPFSNSLEQDGANRGVMIGWTSGFYRIIISIEKFYTIFHYHNFFCTAYLHASYEFNEAALIMEKD